MNKLDPYSVVCHDQGTTDFCGSFSSRVAANQWIEKIKADFKATPSEFSMAYPWFEVVRSADVFRPTYEFTNYSEQG